MRFPYMRAALISMMLLLCLSTLAYGKSGGNSKLWLQTPSVTQQQPAATEQVLKTNDSLSGYKAIRIQVQDTVRISEVSIHPDYFVVRNTDDEVIDAGLYSVAFAKAELYLSPYREFFPNVTELVVTYLPLPEFLTKVYTGDEVLVQENSATERLYTLNQKKPKPKSGFTPFAGLETTGSLVRGVTTGNNQNSTVNSQFDLQVVGKLNDRVSLRASIQDDNIPLQNNGYSQRLDEFDQIFIELYGEKWRVRAGDIDLANNDIYFQRYTKKIQGIEGQVRLGSDSTYTELRGSAALSRGVFTTSMITAIEGNQGPYKLIGNNGELFILIVSGSEVVYVNGRVLTRGETADYVIDYNAGEIRFNPTFPITGEMRIIVDYQYTDNNYTRILATAGATHKRNKLLLETYAYTENDLRNQPILADLTDDQIDALQAAGDDPDLAVAPSAAAAEFSENRILYRADIIGGETIYTFSTDPDDELFSVRFTNVGQGNGDYELVTDETVANIYEYVAPINGVRQGSFLPIVQLVTPRKLQFVGLRGIYEASKRWDIGFEVSASTEDNNLFSDLDDEDNTGAALHLDTSYAIVQRDSLQLRARLQYDYVADDFSLFQELYRAEFDRDWGLANRNGDQNFVRGRLEAQYAGGAAEYQFGFLNYGSRYTGNRHQLNGIMRKKGWSATTAVSVLNTEGEILNTEYNEAKLQVRKDWNQQWAGVRLGHESYEQIQLETDLRTNNSQRYTSAEIFTGVGDSTKVYAAVGARYRVNDSLRNNMLERVNNSINYYATGRPYATDDGSLELYVNYRQLEFEEEGREQEQSLNGRIQFQQRFADGLIAMSTLYETSSGTLPRQDFTYVQVDTGLGVYTWNDYNGNGIQELNEFEEAQFQDQADYVRVLLPNQVFVRTNQNRVSQNLTLNPGRWANSESGWKKALSRFYNQSSFILDRKLEREPGNFELNPFDSGDNELGLSRSFRNALFFNRGKRQYTGNYTYVRSTNETLLSIGQQRTDLTSHTLSFVHLIRKTLQTELELQGSTNESTSENFPNRNFDIDAYRITPQLTYIVNEKLRANLNATIGRKSNQIGDEEELDRLRIATGFSWTQSEKLSLNSEIALIQNDFTGAPFSPVAFQMLEGLQAGRNYTWNLIGQTRITKFLDLNVSYLGRKSETADAIHTGTVQLKAFF